VLRAPTFFDSVSGDDKIKAELQMPTTINLAAAVALSLTCAPAFAETVQLACEYKSGGFAGQNLSVVIDFATSIVHWAANPPERATISERFIIIPETGSDIGRRIDRTTGSVVFFGRNHGETQPGLICSPAKRAF
jgi:hypothetical protein